MANWALTATQHTIGTMMWCVVAKPTIHYANCQLSGLLNINVDIDSGRTQLNTTEQKRKMTFDCSLYSVALNVYQFMD